VGLYTLLSQHLGSSLTYATSGLPGYIAKSENTGSLAGLLSDFDKEADQVVEAVVPAATVRIGEVPKHPPQWTFVQGRGRSQVCFLSPFDPSEFIDSANVGNLLACLEAVNIHAAKPVVPFAPLLCWAS
jgi:hypothetical protein